MTNPNHHSDAETPTVLIVEDEQSLADLYAKWLEDCYDVEIAYGGEEALSTLDETVDVVLLDRRMPRCSGDEVLAALRDQGFDCRVVLVSAVTPDIDVLGMEFDDYLSKPVDSDELHDAVERMLTRAKYDEDIQELQQLMTTLVRLEARKRKTTLQASDAYTDLLERIEELQEEIDTITDRFSDDDFEAEFRKLDSAASGSSSADDNSL